MYSDKTPEYIYQIAIIDDVSSTCEMAKLSLETSLECKVETFNSANDILNANIAPPDLFLIDILMDEMDGITLCKTLKEQAKYEDIPVIFFSAQTDVKSRVRALKAGGVDYLSKPFYPEELIARAKIQLELYCSRKRILEQVEEQKALMQVLCHDLANPISVVSGNLDLAQMAPDNKKYVTRAYNGLKSAISLMDHIREYRSLVDRKSNFSVESLALSALCEEVFAIHKIKADAKNIELRQEIEGDLSITVNRTVFVHNILGNLISNAIKFTEKGGEIVIKASLHDISEVRVQVIDQGIGMSEELLENVFNPRKNFSRNGTEDEPGTGFGMPLVKRYVNSMKGQISIDSIVKTDESPANHGTTVTLFLAVN